MNSFRFRAPALAVAAVLASINASAAAETTTDAAGVPADLQAQATSAAANAQVIDKTEVVGVVRKLDQARNGLSPDTGSTLYRFNQQDIAALPLGESTPLNQIILRTPGVAQDSFGQLHVRGDHANLQYRVNGVIVPEPISGFGQALDARFADEISFLTGALPAQYGYRTAGVIDIRTKGSDFPDGGKFSVLGGSRGYQETSAEIGGTRGPLTYYLTGSYLRNDLGIENPTGARNALHDTTRQGKGFGYLSYVLGEDSRVSLIFGSSDNKFQIPDVPGLSPAFTLDGASAIASEKLNARQDEKNSFQILSYQSVLGLNTDYQISVFHRYTDVHYQPDPIGDLVYNGIAAQILRRNEVSGIQGDLSYRLGAQHTVRAGIFLQRERFGVDNQSTVFAADADGNQTSGVPLSIVDNSHITGHLYGVYVQDEWKPTRALTINYGVRYDQVATVVDESQVSPRIGLVYDVTPRTRVHLGYARYFTPPPTEKIDTTSVQLFQNTTNALPSDANTAVKSERSDYFDTGLAHQLTPEITLGLDGYYRKVRHLQDEGQFGNALIFSAFNYAEGKIYGAETSVSYRAHGLAAYANVGYSVAKGRTVETGQFNFDPDEIAYINSHWVHLDHDQRWSASTGVAYTWSGTTIGADALYGSGLRRGFANTESLPGYWTMNVSATHGFNMPSFGKFDARVSVFNVFDKTYQLRDGSGIGVGAPQFGPRRTLYAGLAKLF
jgi:outer membrane receptor protein involved in Fe transport